MKRRFFPRAARWSFPTTLLLGFLPTAMVCAGDVLEITRDTVLDPGRTYGRIEIKASNLTIDGRGAWLLGPAAAKASPRPSDFQGVAILARGVSNIRLRNINVRGWETGLKIEDAAEWQVEHCDFSRNFDDPAFGWGENGRRGGIILECVGNQPSVAAGPITSGTPACWLMPRTTRSRTTTSPMPPIPR